MMSHCYCFHMLRFLAWGFFENVPLHQSPVGREEKRSAGALERTRPRLSLRAPHLRPCSQACGGNSPNLPSFDRFLARQTRLRSPSLARCRSGPMDFFITPAPGIRPPA